MELINGKWFYGTRFVENTYTVLHRDCAPELELYCEREDHDMNVYITQVDDIHYKVEGKIENMLLFIYNKVLKRNMTLSQILADPDLNIHIEIYLEGNLV